MKSKIMIKISSIILFICLLNSCGYHSRDLYEPSNDEKEVISIAFDQLVGSDTSWHRFSIEYIPQKGFRSVQEKIDHKNYMEYIDSLKALYDTINLKVVVIDSLIKFPSERVSILLDSANLRWNNVDTSYCVLLKKLNETKHSKRFETSFIKSKYKYKIEKKIDSIRYQYLSNIRGSIVASNYQNLIIGYITIARPVFNDSKTKCCIYMSLNCGMLCGKGTVFLFEKLNNNWILKGSCYGWIA